MHRDIGSFYATVLECARAMGGVAKAEQDADDDTNDTQKQDNLTEASGEGKDGTDVEKQNPTDLKTLMEKIETKAKTLSIPITLVRELADKAQKELETAKTYFVYDGCTTQHVRIALELSRLWDIVARFCPGEAE